MASQGNPLIAMAVGLLFFAVGFCLIYNDYNAGQWPLLNGSITSSSLKTVHDADGTMYGANIQYAYEYGGKRYVGSCCGETSSEASYWQKFVDAHGTGTSAGIRVDPSDPYQSRLGDNVKPFDWFKLLFAGLGLLVFGIGCWQLLAGGAPKPI